MCNASFEIDRRTTHPRCDDMCACVAEIDYAKLPDEYWQKIKKRGLILSSSYKKTILISTWKMIMQVGEIPDHLKNKQEIQFMKKLPYDITDGFHKLKYSNFLRTKYGWWNYRYSNIISRNKICFCPNSLSTILDLSFI